MSGESPCGHGGRLLLAAPLLPAGGDRPRRLLCLPQGGEGPDKEENRQDRLETFAYLLRTDLLPESSIPPRDTRMIRDKVAVGRS